MTLTSALVDTIARSILVLIAYLAILPSNPASARDAPFVVLSRAGIWESVSQMIGFRDRLWFVNSVKFRNQNSADLYSYDPVSGDTRYERHFFSQDAGDPVVLSRLLLTIDVEVLDKSEAWSCDTCAGRRDIHRNRSAAP